MIKSLFFDIDGTLVSFETHRIPESTVNALKLAKEKGVGVFISTGRPTAIIDNLGQIADLIDGYITVNGALCKVGDTVVRRCAIPQEDAEAARKFILKHDRACLVVGESEVALLNHKPIYDSVFCDELNVKAVDTSKSAEPLFHKPILQFTPFIENEEEQQLLQLMPHCVSGRWHPEFTDITAKEADKGSGLESMAHYLGLNLSETMAFGDGGNDISILRRAGIGVAMGNAAPHVQAEADYVTTDIDDNGVANALRHFNVI